MKNRKALIIATALWGCSISIFADVPSPATRKPAVPYFMRSMQFQTLQTLIFSPQYAGMVQDPYADLLWNPSLICRQKEKSVYFDLNLGRGASQVDLLPVVPSYYTEEYAVAPRWYSETSINTMNLDPHYNLAALIPLHPKWTLGLFNRVLFDYGPFRSTLNWEEERWELAADSKYFANEYELQRLEIDMKQFSDIPLPKNSIWRFVWDIISTTGTVISTIRDGEFIHTTHSAI
jgi:hypothetical protein